MKKGYKLQDCEFEKVNYLLNTTLLKCQSL
jgi:hypothetical protein